MNQVGLIVLAVVLLAASGFGLYRRRSDGRLTGSLPIHGVDPESHEVAAEGSHERLTSQELGVRLGERATLVQFSSAFCAPCRAARRLLGEVAGTVDGVVYVDVDAESHLELVRRHCVMRTPTVFVLDRNGRVVRRAVGLPRKPEVLAALGEAIP